jgi:peptidoglycan hydrolase CwlO-like protein
MRTLEEEVEDSRWTMQKQERELQKKVDLLRSDHSKIESEMILKDKEVTTMKDEINIIRKQITEVITFSYFDINK